jgi:hypothetical protein
MTRAFRLTALGLCATVAACSAPAFKSDYTVAVTFTPAALAALKAANESATLDSYYYGAPTETAKGKANEDGQIELGQDLTPVDPASPSVHVAGKGILQGNLPMVEGGKITVELRAYSGTDRENLLKCTTVTAPLGDLQAKPAAIACDAA